MSLVPEADHVSRKRVFNVHKNASRCISRESRIKGHIIAYIAMCGLYVQLCCCVARMGFKGLHTDIN